MATIVEGSMPLSVESTTNGTHHGASKLVESLLSNYSFGSSWQIAITALLVLIAYDQCTSATNPPCSYGMLIQLQSYISNKRAP